MRKPTIDLIIEALGAGAVMALVAMAMGVPQDRAWWTIVGGAVGWFVGHQLGLLHRRVKDKAP